MRRSSWEGLSATAAAALLKRGIDASAEWTRILVNGEATQIHVVFRAGSNRALGHGRLQVPRASSAKDQRAVGVYADRGNPKSEAFGPANLIRGILGASLWSR